MNINKISHFFIVFLSITTCPLLQSGCSHVGPYVPPIQQGNIVDQQEVKKLHLGMNKNEVIDILGTPVLVNALDNNYWSYVYTMQKNGGKIEKKQFNLRFEENKLTQINQQ